MLSLSFAQERLWFLAQLEPENFAYNVPHAFHIDGRFDIRFFEQAIKEVIRRHDILRTTFGSINGVPYQIIAPELNFKLEVCDLSNSSSSEQQSEVAYLAKKESRYVFDLAKVPLFRVLLIRLNDREHVLLLTMHHIISDRWSLGILKRELTILYNTYSQGNNTCLPELSVQYADFAEWQRQLLTGEVLQSQLTYWKQQLADAPVLLDLPADHSRPAVQRYRGDIVKFTLSVELTRKLRDLGHQSEGTLYMTLLAAFATLLYRYTNQEDLVIGSPIANRQRSELESLIGFFVNTLALRVNLKGNPPFSELLKTVRHIALDAYAHQDLPFEKLVEELQPERSMSYSPLFQVMFILQNAPKTAFELSNISLTPLDMNTGTAKFDLTFSLTESEHGIKGDLKYNTDLFTLERIERMVSHFQILLESVATNPKGKIANLSILGEDERNQILVEWNKTQSDYPQGKCIHQLFEEQVESTPNATAIVFGDNRLTYTELNEQANRLAHHLQGLGVGPETLVGICVERSLEMIICLFAILKAGGAYVPLHPEHPIARLQFQLAETEAPVLLTQAGLLAELPDYTGHVICLNQEPDLWAQQSQMNPDPITKKTLVIQFTLSTPPARLVPPKGLLTAIEIWSTTPTISATVST